MIFFLLYFVQKYQAKLNLSVNYTKVNFVVISFFSQLLSPLLQFWLSLFLIIKWFTDTPLPHVISVHKPSSVAHQLEVFISCLWVEMNSTYLGSQTPLINSFILSHYVYPSSPLPVSLCYLPDLMQEGTLPFLKAFFLQPGRLENSLFYWTDSVSCQGYTLVKAACAWRKSTANNLIQNAIPQSNGTKTRLHREEFSFICPKWIYVHLFRRRNSYNKYLRISAGDL